MPFDRVCSAYYPWLLLRESSPPRRQFGRSNRLPIRHDRRSRPWLHRPSPARDRDRSR